MKELKSRRMKTLLSAARGLITRRHIRPPAEGHLHSIIYKTAKNGWHYQVEYIKDSRCHNKPYIMVYSFSPPMNFNARCATHYLFGEVNERA